MFVIYGKAYEIMLCIETLLRRTEQGCKDAGVSGKRGPSAGQEIGVVVF